jgi:two-component system, NarL family, nitrate/nitrite response regulator NarL
MPLSILIIDDHPLMSAALAGVLRDLRPRAECEIVPTSQGARQRLRQSATFGLIALDLGLPDGDGFDLLSHIRQCYPDIPVLVVTASEDREDMCRSIAAGAGGYVVKSAAPATLLRAADSVYRGEAYLPPAFASTPTPSPVSESATAEALNARHMDVLRLMCSGQSNKVIAYELGLAEKTVKGRVTAIFKAFGVDNRTQAVLMANKLGLFASAPEALVNVGMVD